MAGFDSGGFDAGGFDSAPPADIPTTLERAIAEVVGTYLEASLSRAAVEALHGTDRTQLDRAVAEVLHEHIPVTVTLTRQVIEVVHTEGFAPPEVGASLNRAIVEVLGYAVEYLGKHGELSRAVIEVIASQALAHRGLNLPSVAVNAVHIAYSMDLELSKPGFWGLQALNGDGYSLEWASASPATITETWRNGATVVQNTFAAPTGRLVRQFETTAGAGPVSLIDLASLRPDDRAGSGVLQELMLWDRALTGPESTRISAYLTCKWVTVACEPQITAPFPACVS